jgi:hypothetical protein
MGAEQTVEIRSHEPGVVDRVAVPLLLFAEAALDHLGHDVALVRHRDVHDGAFAFFGQSIRLDVEVAPDQPRSQGFAALDQMPQIGPGVAGTGGAVALGVERVGVLASQRIARGDARQHQRGAHAKTGQKSSASHW